MPEPIVKQDGKTKNDCESIEYRLEMNGKVHIFSGVNGLALNSSNKDLKLNILEYWQLNSKTNEMLHYSWVTDISLTVESIASIIALAMLSFLTDQIQQLAYQLFKDVLVKTIRKAYYWGNLKYFFESVELESMKQLYEINISVKNGILLSLNSS